MTNPTSKQIAPELKELATQAADFLSRVSTLTENDKLAREANQIAFALRARLSTASTAPGVDDDALIEALAALAHEQWSGWMRYLFKKAQILPRYYQDDRELYVPRWQRQMETSYMDLPENEKESDRQEARRVIEVFRAYAATAAPAAPREEARNYASAIQTLRDLRNTDDPDEIKRQKESWRQLEKDLRVLRVNEDYLFIRLLRERREWYSEDMFRPWAPEEAKAVHTTFPDAVDRIAAESRRHLIDALIADVTAEKHRTWEDGTLNGYDAKYVTTPAAPRKEADLDPLEFWCDLAEVLGHQRPSKVNPASLIAEVSQRLGASTSPQPARDAAREIVKAWLWHTHEHDQQRARISIEQIISRYFPAAPTHQHGWLPIETAPKDKTLVIVALIRDDRVWRVSEASFNGLGWYDIGGKACHWRTHWMPLPAPLDQNQSRESNDVTE